MMKIISRRWLMNTWKIQTSSLTPSITISTPKTSRHLYRDHLIFYSHNNLNWGQFVKSFSTMSDNISLYTLPNTQPIVALECDVAFNALTKAEKLYSHYLSRAAWTGGLIVFVQTSPESPLIFALLHKIFLGGSIESLKTSALESGVSPEDFTAFLVYACGVLSNTGNYKSFGDSKIIPNLPKDKFLEIIKSSKAYKDNPPVLEKIWNKCNEGIYSLSDKVKSLGLGDNGITTYFSSNCDDTDAALVNEFMQSHSLESYNTRCFKKTENCPEDSTKKMNVYTIKLASHLEKDDPVLTIPETIFKEAKFKVTRGDYSKLLEKTNEYLEKARVHAANETEKQMLDKYISHFKTGSLNDHKDGSRFWIKDKGPVVETYIGFIETYRDPAGQRGEFEGFVAMVNKEMSKKFSNLVEKAQDFLPLLPWDHGFEKDVFLRPDFTSLDVLTFAGSGIPAGINIPNYDEIRQSEGFKNVSLGNVIPANMKQDVIPFLSDDDQALLNQHRISAMEVQVGLHELLGHGSGKLLRKSSEGFNFDEKTLKNPLTKELIDKYFLEGETYDSKFGAMGSSYEECRAEAVGLYLSLEKDIVKIFGHEGKDADDVIYVNWLALLWNGCAKALEMYSPEKNKWLQAHSQARYVLLRVCIEAGEGFVDVQEVDDGKNLRFTMNREKINSVGKKAVGEFLEKLQIYKSTGDFESARKMYEQYSEVPDGGPQPWRRWRDIVLAHKQPRKIFVQANTFVENDEVTLRNYDATFEGFIQSWVERFPGTDVVDLMVELAEKDRPFFETK
uniref:Dipeptidyl peptidase 3 n=2 Tax=Fopius arisanus TaxID=64838 RepID=A0A0C9RU76_9HYME